MYQGIMGEREIYFIFMVLFLSFGSEAATQVKISQSKNNTDKNRRCDPGAGNLNVLKRLDYFRKQIFQFPKSFPEIFIHVISRFSITNAKILTKPIRSRKSILLCVCHFLDLNIYMKFDIFSI